MLAIDDILYKAKVFLNRGAGAGTRIPSEERDRETDEGSGTVDS